MKKLLLGILIAAQAYAGEKVILNDTKRVLVILNHQTVRCSHFGYGRDELKVSIPDLESWTVLDHSNIRFGDLLGLPCMTAGMCSENLGVETILDGRDGSEEIEIHRILKEERVLVENGQKCQRILKEELLTNIRGVPFFHQRQLIAELLPEKACR